MTPLSFLRAEMIGWWRGTTGWSAIGFFILTAALSPFVFGRDMVESQEVLAGLVWLLVVFAAMFGFDGLFAEDAGDGRLEIALSGRAAGWLIALQKILAFWLCVIGPVMVASGCLALAIGADMAGALRLVSALALGSPGLALIGGTIAAICLSVRRGGALIVFLTLPLFVPILIFGVAASLPGENEVAARLYLSAVSLVALAICPPLCAAALRQHLS